MADLRQEREHLILADRHLAAGQQRIVAQTALIARMTEHDYNTATARDLLRLLQQTLVTWQEHRQLIPETIARHERATS